MNCEICICFYSHLFSPILREITRIFSIVNFVYFSLADSSTKAGEIAGRNIMWSSTKGPTRLRWDLLVITLVITLNFRVSLKFKYLIESAKMSEHPRSEQVE